MAVYVTDTHPLLWYSTETHRKLSPKVVRLFDRASRGEVLIWVPAMVIWEAGLLERIGRIEFKPSFSGTGSTLSSHRPVSPLRADGSRPSSRTLLKSFPTPTCFDTAIVATARQKSAPLITKDEMIIQIRDIEIFW